MTTEPQPILGTGVSGTIGRFMPSHVIPLNVRLESSLGNLQLPKTPFVLIHAAAIVGERSVRESLSLSRRVNVDATIELADAAYHSECSKFVFVSTSHVYDVSATGSLLTEDSPVLPRGHYALQKFLAEEHLRTMFAKQPERLLIARLFSIIDDQQPAGTLGGAIRALLTNEKANLANTSDERDFLTPRQAANLLHACARNHDLHGVVNVCSGRSMTVRDITELMMGSRRFSELKDRILNGFSSAPSIVGSNEKLRSALADDASHLAETFEKNIRNVFAT